MRPLGRILTFYSYKGGTGRSMGLANVAWMLAAAGRRVLAIDWDLEAPGLHRYFRPFLIDEEVTASEGLMDLVDNYATEAIRPLEDRESADPAWYLQYADLSDYIVSVNFPHFPTGGGIDLLPAGRQGDHYALAVSSFNWQNFYDRLGGGGFIEAVKQHARSQYDYVLIDSRTGVSDTAGICSVQMPDTLVVCFTYNNQSIKGAAAVARSAVAMREKLVEEKLTLHRAGKTAPGASSAVVEEATRPFRVFPVPMRVDSGESDRLAIRQAFARRSFEDLVEHIGGGSIGEYWKSVEVPHTVFYSYEEVLAPFKDDPQDPKTVLAALLRLMRFVTDGDVTDFRSPIAPEQRQAYLDAFAETPLTTAGQKALSESQRESAEQTLARTADAAFAELREEERTIALRVLGRLVRVGREEEGGGYSPIRADFGEFTEPEQRALENLASHRVVTIASNGRSSAQNRRGMERSVSLADPRLLTSWRTLIDALERDREFLAWRQRLRTYLTDWQQSGRDQGALLSGRLLSEADLVALRRRDDLSSGEFEYIAESRLARHAELASQTVSARTLPPGAGVPAEQIPLKVSRARQETPAPRPDAWPRWAALVFAALVTSLVIGLGVLAYTVLRDYFSNPPAPPYTDPKQVRVPQLVGLPATDARTAAEAAGLKVVMSDGTSPDAPFVDGVVVEQSPKYEDAVPSGGIVRLTVSTLTTTVPTITGMNLSDALKTLDKERLKLGDTESRYVADAAKGTIVAQRPLPGSKAAAGTQVAVVVSRELQLSDVRVGIYFPESSDESKNLAEKVNDVVRRAGSQATLAPRPDDFFTGRFKPKQHEIRYNSPPERQLAEELDRLLEQGGLPPFAPVLVRQRSEGFISIFIAVPEYSLPKAK